jgi:hypothetical protein
MAGDGAIVCGLNPGKSRKKDQEEEYHVKHRSYESVVTFWHDKGYDHPYHRKLRQLVRALNLAGPILWTDTVKCQGPGFSHLRFPNTVRCCVPRYLRRELKACPADWIAVAVGRDAFATFGLECPGRFVLGVPHPTGRYSAKDFDGLLDDNARIKPRFLDEFTKERAKDKNGALWLTSAKP